MTVLADVYVSASDLALTPTLRAVSNVRAELERGSVTDPERPPLFVRVTGDDFAEFERALDADETVTDATLLDENGTRRLYQLAHTDRSITLYPLYADLDGALLSAKAVDAGWSLHMRFPDRDALVAFREACRERGVSFRLERLSRPDEQAVTDAYGLTAAQRETLRRARELGYFDVPRGISQTDLAADLGVSKNALSQRLRRATATVLDATIGAEESTPPLDSRDDV